MVHPHPARRTKVEGFTLIELLVVIAIIGILAAILFPVFARARENARRSSCQSNLKQIGIGVLQYVQDFDEKFPMYYQGQPFQSGTYVAQTDTSALGYTQQSWDPGSNASIAAVSWMDITQPYIKSKQVFSCPSQSQENLKVVYGTTTFPPFYGYSSAINGFLKSNYGGGTDGIPSTMAEIRRPSEVIMVLDYGHRNSYANPSDFRDAALSSNLAYSTTLSPHLEGTNICFADGHVKWQSRSKSKGIATPGFCNINTPTAVSYCDPSWNPFLN